MGPGWGIRFAPPPHFSWGGGGGATVPSSGAYVGYVHAACFHVQRSTRRRYDTKYIQRK